MAWNTMSDMLLVWILVHCSLCVVSAQTSASCSQFSNYQEYESRWKTEYPGYAQRGTYPFGTQYCDANATTDQKTSGLNANIQFAIPFYGAIYRSLLISSDGFVTLEESPSTRAGTLDYMAINWPNVHYTPRSLGAVDPPLIAPFYAEMDFRIGQPNDPGQLSWRVLERSGTGSTVADGMLDRLSEDVRRASVDAAHFVAQSGVVVTWYNVTFSRATTCTTDMNGDTCRRNTIQMALVTDSRQTYAIFNYVNITWVGSGNAQHCDPTTGMPSANNPQCQPAQVGFNAGSGRGFTSLPYTTAEGVASLDKLSGTDVIGRWIYHVTGNVIRHAGCTSDPSLAGSHEWPLVANPGHGAMFGGHWVNVSGPCFDSNQNVRCRFGDVETMAIYWGNPMQVTCVQPPLSTVGPVNLSVSVDQGQGHNYDFSTIFSVLQQERVDQSLGVAVVNPTADWLNPSRIDLSWNQTSLSSPDVIVQLFGYNHGHWDLLHTFNSTRLQNSGSYSIVSPPSSLCTQQNPSSDCSLYSIGAFRVSSSGVHSGNFSRPVARACVNVTSHLNRTESTGARKPWIICHDEWRDVIVDWIPPPCGHGNATKWPWYPNGSTLMPHNRTWSNGSWLCSYYNTSNGMWHVADCTRNITIRPIPHWPRYYNVTSLPNTFDPPCIHYLDENSRLPLSAMSPARSMWSAPIPLGWFMNAAATSSEGTDWSHQRCAKWKSDTSEPSESAAIADPNSTPDPEVSSRVTPTDWRPSSLTPAMNWRPSSVTPPTNWLLPADFSPCPCTLNQVKIDFGRFQPTLDCNADNSLSAGSCWTNRGATACFQSVRTTRSGASNRCCYDHVGNLLYAGDSDSGSHVEYSAPWGLNRAARKVPSLAHWVDDLLPYYYCCGWQQPSAASDKSGDADQNWSSNFAHDCFNVYATARPTVDCKYYRPAGLGAIIGDPHFITFDGTKYSFNGWGEFWLIGVDRLQRRESESESHPRDGTIPPRGVTWPWMDKTLVPRDRTVPPRDVSWPPIYLNTPGSRESSTRSGHSRNNNPAMDQVEFALQGRFEPTANETGGQQQTGTVLTAVAMRQIDTAVISITINDHNVRPRLLVYYDNVTVEFNSPSMFWHQLRDVIIVSNDQSECSNVTVIFHQSGIGVNVAWKNGAMNALVSLPPEFKTNTEGLLGQWNGNPSDDLTPRASSSADSTPVSASDSSAVYYNFGLSWIVQPNETLFSPLYRAAMNYDYYRNTGFVPMFNTTSPSNMLLGAGTSAAVCGTNTECLYDFAATGNANLAADTLAAIQWDTEAREMSTPVVSCGWLDIPYSVRQGELRYTVGSQVTVIGCMPGYKMTGVQTTYMCEATTSASMAIWSPNIAQTCYWVGDGMSSAEKTAVIIPVVIVGSTIMAAVVAVIIIAGVKRRKRRRAEREKDKKKSTTTTATAASAPSPPVATTVTVFSTAPGPGKTVVSPLIIPVVGTAAGEAECATPEVTEITTATFNRVVRGSLSSSSLLDHRTTPVQEQMQQQQQHRATPDQRVSAGAPPRYSLVSTATTASTINSVLCGPVRLIQPTPAMAVGSQSHLDTTISDVFLPADDHLAPSAGTLVPSASSTSVHSGGPLRAN